MPIKPNAKRIAEAARKIRATAERELAKALEQARDWKNVLVSLGGAKPVPETRSQKPRRKPGRKPSKQAGGRKSLVQPILDVLAGGGLNTKAVANKIGASYKGAGNALKRLAKARKVKSKKAARERIWQLAGKAAPAKPAKKKAAKKRPGKKKARRAK